MSISRTGTRLGVAVALVALAGCGQQFRDDLSTALDTAGGGIGQMFGGGMPPDDGTVCYTPQRIEFYEAARRANDNEAAMAMTSTVAQGIVGAFMSGGGGSFGNVFARALAEDFFQAMQQVQQDVVNDRQRIREFQNAFDALVQCRERSARAINADLNAGRIDRAEAEQRMAELRELLATDIEVARRTNQTIETRTDSFQVAVQQARREAQAPEAAETAQRVQEVEETERAVQTNQQALQSSVASVEQAEALETEVEGSPFSISSLFQRLFGDAEPG